MVWVWIGFILLILTLLSLDLGVFHRKAHAVSVKEACAWSVVWISLGISFSVFVYFGYENHWMGLGTKVDATDGIINDGTTAMVKYLTGYIVEESLSVDNIFVIAMICSFFSVPAMYQHRVLFFGILGALVMRGLMIGIGAQLVSTFHWILYIFGVFLVLTGIKMLFQKESHADPGNSFFVRMTRRIIPITRQYHGKHFIVRAGHPSSLEGRNSGEAPLRDEVVENAKPGTWLLTPLGLAVIVVEFSDLIFAVDSIPAIFTITADPFLVFTSNVFAILGLRSLYFAVAGMLDTFRFLKVSLSLILVMIGVKMLTAKWIKLALGEHFNFYLLGAIFGILTVGLIASIVIPHQTHHDEEAN
ncbi:MAG: membrane protein [Candidatus Hydrogenedentota bacterium]